MSVEIITGDLLSFDKWNVIAHSCNAKGVMGKGIALAIKNKFPLAYQVYETEYKAKGLHLGEMTVAVFPDGKKIANMITQYSYGNEGRMVDYEAFYTAFEALQFALEAAHAHGRIYTLAVPYKISCNNAGGDWKVISAMLYSLFEESPVTLYIVKLPELQPLNYEENSISAPVSS